MTDSTTATIDKEAFALVVAKAFLDALNDEEAWDDTIEELHDDALLAVNIALGADVPQDGEAPILVDEPAGGETPCPCGECHNTFYIEPMEDGTYKVSFPINPVTGEGLLASCEDMAEVRVAIASSRSMFGYASDVSRRLFDLGFDVDLVEEVVFDPKFGERIVATVNEYVPSV